MNVTATYPIRTGKEKTARQVPAFENPISG